MGQRFWGWLFGIVLFGIFVLTAVSPFVGWWLPPKASSFSADQPPGRQWTTGRYVARGDSRAARQSLSRIV